MQAHRAAQRGLARRCASVPQVSASSMTTVEDNPFAGKGDLRDDSRAGKVHHHGGGKRTKPEAHHSMDEAEEDMKKGTDWPKCFDRWLKVLSLLTIIAALLVATANVLAIMSRFSLSNVAIYQDVLSRCFNVVFALVAVLCELKIQALFKQVHALNYWWTRGLFYCFVGLQTVDEAVGTYQIGGDSGPVIVRVASYTMMALGAIYIVMEMACLRGRAERRRKQAAMRATKDSTAV